MNKAKSITVFSPASVSNVGPGFDVLGFPLEGVGEEVSVTRREDEQYVLSTEGADLPNDPDKNVAAVAIKSLCSAKDHTGGFDIHIVKHFTPGSGLGSSASSAVGAVFAVNELMGWGLTREELIPFALDGEYVASGGRHADNIAPCMLGGFVGVTSCDPFDAYQIPFPEDLKVLIILPEVVVKTAEARAILPKELSLSDGIQQWATMGGLVTGLVTNDYDRIKKSLSDLVATPYRKELIPGFDEVQGMALKANALGCNISGSGPAMFAFFRDQDDVILLQKKISIFYEGKDIPVKFFESKVNPRGVELA